MGLPSQNSVLAACALALVAFLLFLNLIVPPWRTEVPLVALEVPAASRRVDAIPASRGSAAGRSVLLVTIDTVRPDRLGFHGNSIIDTPILDRLAREGAIFSRAVATASSTLPSHASILTGLYPHRHGAPANAAFHLNEDVATLSTLLSGDGYDTAAFVSAFVLDSQFGLARGFDVYDDDATETGSEFSHNQRRADRTTDRAIEWLQGSQRPFFLWVHYYDPHASYWPPLEYDRYPLLYDGELAFTDVQLGRIVDAARGFAKNDLLIAVTSDHGEAFGEQGEDNHSILIQEATLRIPLILHAPGAIPSGVHVPTRVSQVDILPTILSLLGKPIPATLDGVDLTQTPDPERPIMAETIEGQVSFGWARLSALYQGRWKLVDGPNPELYDLEADPLARENLGSAHPEEILRLRAALNALRPDSSTQARSSHALSPEDVERLESLGYSRPAAAGARSSKGGVDPASVVRLLADLDKLLGFTKGEIPTVTRLSALREGILLPSQGEDVIGLIEEFAERHPDFAPAQLYLQNLYLARGRVEEAKAAGETFRALVQGRGTD